MITSKNKRNNVKKWLIPATAALSFACLGIAAGCSKEPEYFKLNYDMPRGVTINCYHEDGARLDSGTEIRKGYEVKFSLSVNEYCTGTPRVIVNGQVMTPNADNMYTFVMNRTSRIIVDGVEYVPHYTVRFTKGASNRIWYEYNGADVDDGYEVGFVQGDTVTFKMRTSVYYKGGYDVLANTEILDRNSDGTYSFVCTEDTNITVHGLESQEDFYAKEVRIYNELLAESNTIYSEIEKTHGDELKTIEESIKALDPDTQQAQIDALNAQKANILKPYTDKNAEVTAQMNYVLNVLGRSWEHPFEIANAIDLYAMAYYINDDYFVESGFQYAYYKIKDGVTEIDMQGEQLFVIGDGFNSSAYFCGHFDGNGAVIKNFTLSDVLIDQEEYVNIYLASVGMFGYASASEYGAAEIYNLHLENYSVSANAASHVSAEVGSSLFIGGIAGRSLGAQIAGCSASGTVNVRGNVNVSVFAGGLVGYSQSIAADSVSFYSMLRSCSSSVNINAAGFVLAAGGIVGYLDSGSALANANVINCYSTGSIVGANHTGGVVGYVGPYSSVQNCYSTGNVYASSNFHYRDADTEMYCFANAGGIAGFADYNTAVADCYSVATLTAVSVEGSRYQKTDAIVANVTEDGAPYADSLRAVIVGCGDKATATAGWSSGDWVMTGDHPTVNTSEGSNVFNVTVKRGDTSATVDVFSVDSEYSPVSYWYNNTANQLDEYVTAGGLRSYGYYFDSACTLKVPSGYVPMHDVVFYVRYADYSDVAGTYYFAASSRISLELRADGTLVYHDGALEQISSYTYNGTDVMLYDTSLAYLSANAEDAYGYVSFAAKVTGGKLVITDPTYFPAGSELTCNAKFTPFVYGGYYNADGGVYQFGENNYGSASAGSGVKSFTYTANGTVLNVRYSDGTTVTGKIDASGLVSEIGNVTLYKLDDFAGTWKKSLTSMEVYEFDGKSANGAGTWNYLVNGESVATGAYTVSGNTLTNAGAGSFTDAVMNQGILTVHDAYGATVYGKDDGYLGVWHFVNSTEPVTLTLNGLDRNGIGKGKISYDAVADSESNVSYDVISYNGVNYVCVYADGVQIASLGYNAAKNTLEGEVYSIGYGAIRSGAVFCLEDEFNGSWTSTEADFATVVFNGRGMYDLRATDAHMTVRGYITIKGTRVRYTYDAATAQGSFTLNSVVYTVVYDRVNDTVIIKNQDGTATVATLTR